MKVYPILLSKNHISNRLNLLKFNHTPKKKTLCGAIWKVWLNDRQ